MRLLLLLVGIGDSPLQYGQNLAEDQELLEHQVALAGTTQALPKLAKKIKLPSAKQILNRYQRTVNRCSKETGRGLIMCGSAMRASQ